MDFKDTRFYQKIHPMLQDFVNNGGDVNNLGRKDTLYNKIKDYKIYDTNGKAISLEEKFTLLGYPRARKYSTDVRADLIKELEEYVGKGGDVNNLGRKDTLYNKIKDYKVYDTNGKAISLEEKFTLLGYPRARQTSTDVRADLIKDIEEYIANGETFDVQMKTLPFYERLHTYSKKLQRDGINLSHEEIIRDDLGFKTFSIKAMRCRGLQKLKEFRKNGYVDDYHTDDKYSSYIIALAEYLNIPYYLLITLIADERLSKYVISTDYVKYVQTLLENYIAEYGDFVGIKKKEPKTYEAFSTLCKTFSDGSGQKFSKKEWLVLFGLDGFDNKFAEKSEFENVDIAIVMQKLKDKFGDAEFSAKDVDRDIYRKILKHATQYAISVKTIFDEYGLNYRGINIKRLNHVTMQEIPYFKEMKALRDELIEQSGISLQNGNTEEECLEVKIKAVQQAYKEYEQKIESFEQENPGSFDDDLIVE